MARQAVFTEVAAGTRFFCDRRPGFFGTQTVKNDFQVSKCMSRVRIEVKLEILGFLCTLEVYCIVLYCKVSAEHDNRLRRVPITGTTEPGFFHTNLN